MKGYMAVPEVAHTHFTGTTIHYANKKQKKQPTHTPKPTHDNQEPELTYNFSFLTNRLVLWFARPTHRIGVIWTPYYSRMNLTARLTQSSLGKKLIVALTGLALIGFLIAHLAGNLAFHAGPDAINTYAEWLHHRPLLVWSARLGLLALFALHIFFTIKLRIENRKARPEKYAHTKTLRASRSSRIMILSGLTILAFIILHLLQFTILPDNTQPNYFEPRTDGTQRHDVYAMIQTGFRNHAVSAFYVIAIALLCSHLRHGVASLFQTLGLTSPTLRSILDKGGLIFSIAIFLGYTSIPAVVLIQKSPDTLSKSQAHSQ